MRLNDVSVDADGTERKKLLSGAGVIVVVRGDCQSRRKFNQFCMRWRAIATPAEENGNASNRYNRRTGEVAVDVEPVVTAWQVIADGPVLADMLGIDDEGRRIRDPKPWVESWQFALSIRIPVGAQGSGPEKLRPPMGTVFGKPSTVSATKAALAADVQRRRSAELRAEAGK